jgi:hypothetical protein
MHWIPLFLNASVDFLGSAGAGCVWVRTCFLRPGEVNSEVGAGLTDLAFVYFSLSPPIPLGNGGVWGNFEAMGRKLTLQCFTKQIVG